MNEQEQIAALIKSTTAKLMEMGCDSCTTIVTAVNHAGTQKYTWGGGNIYARRAAMAEYLTECDESDRLEVRNDHE